MFAITAVLPANLGRGFGLAFEIQLAQCVTCVPTPDRILAWGEKASTVLGTEYSHFRCSYWNCVTIGIVPCSKHGPLDKGGKTAAKAASEESGQDLDVLKRRRETIRK
jgi:hypothetical protein